MIIQNVLLWLECKHRDACAVGEWHRQQRSSLPLQPTHNGTLHQSHSYRPTAFPLGRIVDFVVTVGLRPGRFGGHISESSYSGDHDALRFTFGVEAANDAQTGQHNSYTVRKKDHQRKNLIKTDTVIPQRI